MLYEEERKLKITEYIQGKQRASVQELAEHFNVSESTIRRDLKELEDARLLKRTHGGAINLESVNFEPAYTEKEDVFSREKELIASKAAELISDGDTILLDSGTTTQYLARELKRFNRLTVVTNSLMVARELENLTGIETIVSGGSLRQNTLSLVGPVADESFKMMRVDKAFIATNGIDLKEGLTTPNITEASTKRKMIEIAKQVILLTDHTKFGKISFSKFADISDIDTCIVDSDLSDKLVKQYEDKGINIMIAAI